MLKVSKLRDTKSASGSGPKKLSKHKEGYPRFGGGRIWGVAQVPKRAPGLYIWFFSMGPKNSS